MKKDNVFWGVLLLLGGLFLIISKLGFLGEVNAFSIVFSIILVGIIIKSVIKLRISGVLFPIAFLCIIYDEKLGITAITPWTVLIAALLGTIGISLIFGKKHHHKCSCFGKDKIDYTTSNIDLEDEAHLRIDTSFGASIKYIKSNCLEQVDIDSSFGSIKCYFDGARLKDNQAIINLDISFGAAEIYIPKDWRVINNANVSIGGIEEKNKCDCAITNTVTLVGSVSFGGVDIYYI